MATFRHSKVVPSLVDGDGTYDASTTTYDGTMHGGFVLNVDKLALLGNGGPVDDGTYSAHMKATTESGETFERDVPITVMDLPPVVHIEGLDDASENDQATVNEPYVINVSASDPGGDAFGPVTIDWGDGSTPEVVSSSGNMSHVFAAEGTYLVQVKVEQDGDPLRGYLGFIVTVDDQDVPTLVPSSPSVDPNSGDLQITLNGGAIDGSSITDGSNYQWDLDGDGFFNDGSGQILTLHPNPNWQPETLGTNGDFEYRARVRVVDPNTGIAGVYLVAYTVDATGSLTGDIYREKAPAHVVETAPAGFDIDSAFEIVKVLRPDVFNYWKNNAGKIELQNTQGGFTGWMTWDVYTYYAQQGGRTVNYLRLHNGFNELQAAQAIIDATENGYFRHTFKAYKILDGADDFTNVDNFAKWQKWYRKEMGTTTATGAELVLNWYSMQFVGADFVMTMHQADEAARRILFGDGPIWSDALLLVQVLPFLKHVPSLKVVVKNSDGSVAAEIQSVAGKGWRVMSGVGGACRWPSFVPGRRAQDIGLTFIRQSTDTCSQSSVKMILNDFNIPPRVWKVAPDDLGGHTVGEMQRLPAAACRRPSCSPLRHSAARQHADTAGSSR